MKDKYILDSTVWIQIQRGDQALIEQVDPLIQANQVCMVDLIIAELLRGTRTKKDYDRLHNTFLDFPIYGTSWERVAALGYEVGRKGLSPPLTDLYIAQVAMDHDKTLMSHDKHFRQITKIVPFAFIHLN